MDYQSMTPEELREMAARMEARALFDEHLGDDAPRFSIYREPKPDCGFPRQFAREVEFEGRVYTLDMRRFKSRKYMRMLAELRDTGEDAPIVDQLKIFDYALEPVSGDIERAVADKFGYDDFQEYYRICGGIFEKVNAKN